MWLPGSGGNINTCLSKEARVTSISFGAWGTLSGIVIRFRIYEAGQGQWISDHYSECIRKGAASIQNGARKIKGVYVSRCHVSLHRFSNISIPFVVLNELVDIINFGHMWVHLYFHLYILCESPTSQYVLPYPLSHFRWTRWFMMWYQSCWHYCCICLDVIMPCRPWCLSKCWYRTEIDHLSRGTAVMKSYL